MVKRYWIYRRDGTKFLSNSGQDFHSWKRAYEKHTGEKVVFKEANISTKKRRAPSRKKGFFDFGW